MHRSGTSLAASLVAAGGIHMGDRLLAADANNPHGYHEDLDFVTLNREMLLATTPADDAGHPDWGWTEHERRGTGLQAFVPRARELVAARDATGNRWGFKDPRSTLLLDFWDGVLGEPLHLLVYRLPWAVADSMQRLGAEVFLAHPGYGLRIWAYYNRRLLAFHARHRDRSVLVCVDAFIDAPERLAALLAQRLGVDVPAPRLRELVDTGALRRPAAGDPLAALVAAAHPDVDALLRELDAVADLPAGHLWDTSPRASSPRAATRVSVVIPCFNQGETLLEAVASAQRDVEAPVELVVVDDGSDEPATLAVLDALRGSGITVHAQANAGVAAARNAGVARTQAAAILPLDADNRLSPRFVDQALAVLDARPEVGVVYGDRREFGLRDGVVDVPPFDLSRLLAYNVIDACAVVRRSAWEAVGGYDTTAPVAGWEDWDLWLAVAEAGWSFHHLPVPGFEYRVRPGSMLSGTLADDARRQLYRHVLGRHEALYRTHLPDVLVHGQRAAEELSAAARALEDAHREVAARDETLRWLHGEVAVRDEEVRWLHAEVALRDAEIRRFTAAP